MNYRLIIIFCLVVTAFMTVTCKNPTSTDQVAKPTFNPPAGTYSTNQTVTISCSTVGATIRYTIDGSVPGSTSTIYTGELAVSSTTTLKAKAFKEGMTDSQTASATYTISITQGEMILVPSGSFTRGANYTVSLNSFYIGKYEVMLHEWQDVMGTDYGVGNGLTYPVYLVNWYLAIKYCNLRSIAEGLTPVYTIGGSTNPASWGAIPETSNAIWDAAICNWSASGYRLPTEAEWEYAARGASNTPNYTYSGSDDINAVAWFMDNSVSPYGNRPVGTKAHNGLGLYDMSGNIGEWCWDWFDGAYYSVSPANNPTGPATGTTRVRRGGYWNTYAGACTVSYRDYYNPGSSISFYGIGVRVCRKA